MEHFCFNKEFGENWFSYSQFYSEVVQHFGSGSVFVEVGSWKGKSAAYLGVEIFNSNKDIKFFCVDPWFDFYKIENLSEEESHYSTLLNHEDDFLYKTFLKNVMPVLGIIIPIRLKSSDAADLFEDNSVDFVFIDGDHSEESVLLDIQKWLPKVRKNGILSGHDFGAPSVRKAVSRSGISPILEGYECWFYLKQ